MTSKTYNGEILVALCSECKCCLADGPHCWFCHTTSIISAMCGCGECSERADSFYDLEEERRKGRNIRYTTRALIK